MHQRAEIDQPFPEWPSFDYIKSNANQEKRERQLLPPQVGCRIDGKRRKEKIDQRECDEVPLGQYEKRNEYRKKNDKIMKKDECIIRDIKCVQQKRPRDMPQRRV